MFSKDLFTKDNFDSGLVDAVGNRLANGEYSDAIIAGVKYLTDTLREVGGVEGDGAQLVGQVLGGTAPIFALNKLQTVSEKDEQKGIEQFIRGIYIGIRNPRTHDAIEDTEDFAVRVLVAVDLSLQYLAREAQVFDVAAFVNRIYEPHFVPNAEYAQALVSEIPNDKVVPVFLAAFSRRTEGDLEKTRHAFTALYQLMNAEQMAEVTHALGDELRGIVDTAKIAEIFRLLKPEAWSTLQGDVRMRMENIIIEACKEGTYDVHSGLVNGGIGTWGNTFGRYFTRRDDLADALINRLYASWYTQNFVGKYYMYPLPALITGERIEKAIDALAYAALGNKAKAVRARLLEVAQNYPEPWKNALKVAVQERKDSDPEYADSLLGVLGQAKEES